MFLTHNSSRYPRYRHVKKHHFRLHSYSIHEKIYNVHDLAVHLNIDQYIYMGNFCVNLLVAQEPPKGHPYGSRFDRKKLQVTPVKEHFSATTLQPISSPYYNDTFEPIIKRHQLFELAISNAFELLVNSNHMACQVVWLTRLSSSDLKVRKQINICDLQVKAVLKKVAEEA